MRERRELSLSEGAADKFWRIELAETSHTVWFGRSGTQGQRQVKEFDSAAAAKASYDKLVAEKLKKGYVDAAAQPLSAAAPAGNVPPPAKPAPKGTRKAAAKAAEKAPEAATEPKSAEAEALAATVAPPPTPAIAATSAASGELVPPAPVRIDLPATDWFRATFRPRVPLVRGEPAPFDAEKCLDALSKLRGSDYGWDFRWGDLRRIDAMTPEEARFWLEAMTFPMQANLSAKELATQVRKLASGQDYAAVVDPRRAPNGTPAATMLPAGLTYGRSLDPATAVLLLQRRPHYLPEETARPLAAVLSVDEYLTVVRSRPVLPGDPWKYRYWEANLLVGFGRYVLPYLTDAEIERLRGPIEGAWDPRAAVQQRDLPLPVDCYLAAYLGLHAEIRSLTAQWPDKAYAGSDHADHYHRPQDIVLGLGSPEEVAAEWRRLGLRHRNAEHVRAFLACTEFTALDCIRDSVLAETNKEACEDLINAFGLAEGPATAGPMLECKLGAKAGTVARAWLEKHPQHAVTGLIPVAGGRGKLAEAALEYLQELKQRGQTDLLSACLAREPDAAVAAKVRAEVLEREEKIYRPLDEAATPPTLREAFAAVGKLKAKTLPGWAHPGVLPALRIGERRLTDDQTAVVLQLLAATPLGPRPQVLAAVRETVERVARDEFVWKLFRSWADDGFPPKEKWAMGAIGHLGGDGAAVRLTPLIRSWPGESQHARAVFGLECLRAIGSDAALTHLAGMAQKLSFKGLKAKAERFVEEIAAERGLTRAELEDRIVPDCGLDERGRREFSFGARSFSFVLDGDLKPVLRDADGKLRGDLPKPNSKDDATLAEQSVADWKLLKKQIRDVAALQATRLELAMTTGRRWPAADFERLLVGHPLLGHLVRKLVWGAYDATGTRVATFRTTEERDFADVQDNAVSLAGIDRVGIVHPLELSDAERSAWGEVLSDYELISPFPQLGRATYALEGSEADQTVLTRFDAVKLPAPTLVFGLEKLGWLRGAGLDAGCFTEHSKYFPAADLTVVVSYEGHVGMQWIDPNEMLQFAGCRFVPGKRKPSGYDEGLKSPLRLGSLPPVVVSEVISDLQTLRSKAT